MTADCEMLFFEIARVLVSFNHVASFIVNANHGITAFDSSRLAKIARCFVRLDHGAGCVNNALPKKPQGFGEPCGFYS